GVAGDDAAEVGGGEVHGRVRGAVVGPAAGGRAGDRQALAGDGEVGRDVGEVVVGVRGERALVDLVRAAADGVAGVAAQGAGEVLAGHQRAAGDAVAQRRIVLAVGLGLRIRGDRDRPRGDVGLQAGRLADGV